MGVYRELNNNTDLFDGNVKEKAFAAKRLEKGVSQQKISTEVDHFLGKRK